MAPRKSRLSDDELLARQLGEEPVAPVVGKGNRAICHPKKPTFADGWCETCYAKRRELAPQELDGKVENELAALVKGNQELEKITRESRHVLETNLKTYAELHMQATKRAAAKGDARPAQWALERVIAAGDKPIVAPEQKAPQEAGGGVKVLINIPLGGLPVLDGSVIDVQKQ